MKHGGLNTWLITSASQHATESKANGGLGSALSSSAFLPSFRVDTGLGGEKRVEGQVAASLAGCCQGTGLASPPPHLADI